MNLLLDTHIALWALADDPRLSETARSLILDEGNHIFASVASMWEIAIKRARRLDSIPLSGVEFLHHCERAGYRSLPVRERHVAALETLPPLHADPFDRILLAQARAESMLLLTHDAALAGYGEGVRQV